jgi:hypothetical protein
MRYTVYFTFGNEDKVQDLEIDSQFLDEKMSEWEKRRDGHTEIIDTQHYRIHNVEKTFPAGTKIVELRNWAYDTIMKMERMEKLKAI